MQTKKQKKQIVEEIVSKVKEAKAVVFSDFKGVKVKDLTLLKKELRKEGVDFKVSKKTLINIAFKEAGIEVDTKKMEGQVAVSISTKDEVSAAKIIEKFAKTNQNLKILGGILENKLMSIEQVKALAKLPNKEEMLGMLVGTIKAPISGFVNVCAGNLRGLVQVLKGISESKN
ncbi:MAG: 50S ribosomal protein L10 [Parcubacteria group bacterium]|jgi:large subunit ribosomal protein L10